MVVAAGELLNLALDPLLVQFDVLGTPVNFESSLEEALLGVKYHHSAHSSRHVSDDYGVLLFLRREARLQIDFFWDVLALNEVNANSSAHTELTAVVLAPDLQ